LKQTTLCIGANCYKDADFEEFNCAVPIETANSDDVNSLGLGQPGCSDDEECQNYEICEICENGLAPPCEPPVEPY